MLLDLLGAGMDDAQRSRTGEAVQLDFQSLEGPCLAHLRIVQYPQVRRR